MSKFVIINGKILSEKQATISVKERACRFGDGIFETCKIVDGIIYNYKAHEARIIKGLKALQISASINNLKTDSYHLIKKNHIKNGVLRIMISRGIGSLGYLPTLENKGLVVIETLSEQKISLAKIRLGVSKIKAPRRSLALQKCKTMQSLNYILAKIAAKKNGNFDDILLSEAGFVAEASSANIFWVKNGKIFTPSAKCDILFGTVRDKIMQKFPAKINLVEARISRLLAADEIFLTNASFLVLAVDELLVGKKIVRYKKLLSQQVLQWLRADIKKEKI